MKRAFAFTPPDNPEGRGQINYSTEAKLALTEDLRLKVVRKMYELRFREPPPARRSVEQLRGIEDLAFARRMHYWRNNMV